MKLVIEIDENEYIGIKSFPNSNTSYPWTLHLYDAVRNGTPLPKGHGDLIDRSLLSPDSDYEDGLFYAVSIGQINGVPTIIEADKENEE